MLDGRLKQEIDPWLDKLAKILVSRGVSANGVTLAGFFIGMLAALAIGFSWWWTGLMLLLLSRLCDGLDGAIARRSVVTDLGGYLDIVLDFAFYGAIPLGFIFANPAANALAGSVLLFSFYVNGASFLAYSVLAEKNKMKSSERGKKSIYFTTGLAEATETLAVFVLACLLPDWFSVLAWGFALVCFYTTLSRLMLASRTFG